MQILFVEDGVKHPENMCTTEHLIPKKIKKHNQRGNIVLACHKCNIEKGDKSLGEYRKVVSMKRGVPVKAFLFYGEKPALKEESIYADLSPSDDESVYVPAKIIKKAIDPVLKAQGDKFKAARELAGITMANLSVFSAFPAEKFRRFEKGLPIQTTAAVKMTYKMAIKQRMVDINIAIKEIL